MAVLGVLHFHLVALEDAGQRKDVPDVVVDDQRLLAVEGRVGAVQLIEQPLLLGRQRALHPVQEKSGFVEQALGRLDVLDDDGLRQLPELGFLALRQLLAGVDDHRHLRHRLIGAHLLEQLQAAHVRQAQVQHDAVEPPLLHLAERFLAGADRSDLDVAIADQLDQGVALHVIVLDDQQGAQLAIAEIADRVEGLVQRLLFGGFAR